MQSGARFVSAIGAGAGCLRAGGRSNLGSYTRRSLAEEEPDQNETGGEPPDPGRIERPRLRRRPLGYRRADVDEALEARDSELSELRRDVAALWLAFAQHDRMLRTLSGAPPPQAIAAPAPETPAPEPLESEAASIGAQLSELDEVLAAIEMATQTLERTYAEEIQGPDRPGEDDADTDSDAAEPAAG